MSEFSKRTKGEAISDSLRKYYSRQAIGQIPHRADKHLSENKNDDDEKQRHKDKTKPKKQRSFQYRSGHACVPYLGSSAITAKTNVKKR